MWPLSSLLILILPVVLLVLIAFRMRVQSRRDPGESPRSGADKNTVRGYSSAAQLLRGPR